MPIIGGKMAVRGSAAAAVPTNGTGGGAQVVASSGSIRIRLDGLERTFVSGKQEVKALGPLDLDVAEGEFLCIVGPSGCGKSTLLRVLAGLIKPTAGRVEIAQEGSGHAPLAMVFQDHGVYPWKTVEHNVRLGLDLTKTVPKPERRRLVAARTGTPRPQRLRHVVPRHAVRRDAATGLDRSRAGGEARGAADGRAVRIAWTRSCE